MEGWLISSLLLLVNRYLLIELQQKLLWVIQYASPFLIITIFPGFLLGNHCNLCKLVIIVITVKKLLNTTSSEIGEVLFKLRIV